MTRTVTLIIAVSLALTTASAGRHKYRAEEHIHFPDLPVLRLCPEALPAIKDEPSIAMAMIRDAAEPYIDNRIRGIDVSHHQGHIDWNRVSEDKQVNYCFIKATESNNFTDSRYAENLRRARAAGVKVGAYHFFSPTTSPVAQLQNMISVVKKDEQDIIPLIDVEKIGRRANVHAFQQRLKTFLVAVEKHYGIRPLVYTGENFYNKYLAGHFTDYRFMIAKYREPEPRLNDRETIVLMWQYTSTGTISGVTGDCDQSVFLKDYNVNDILIK